MAEIILAPLEGVTDRTFRSCFYRHFTGVDRTVAPFLPIPDRAVRVPRKTLRDVALPEESPVPEIPQLLLSRPETFLVAGRALADAGFTRVNWNLGCPSRGVVRKGKGAGMLPWTEDILALLDRVCPVLPLKLSLKVRLGLNSEEELYRLLPRLKGYPLEEIICHPRLGIRMYRGEPDLEAFERVLSLTDFPVVYNGDILTAADFRTLSVRFPGVSGWMIGRGLAGNPFLGEQIKGICTGLPEEEHPLGSLRFRAFLEDLIEEYSRRIAVPRHLTGFMKGLLSYVLRGFPEETIWRDRLKKLQSRDELMAFLESLYGAAENQKTGFSPV